MNLEKYANEQLANSSSSFAVVDVSSTSSSSNNTTTKTTETDYMTLKRNSDTMVDRYGIAEEFWHAMIRFVITGFVRHMIDSVPFPIVVCVNKSSNGTNESKKKIQRTQYIAYDNYYSRED